MPNPKGNVATLKKYQPTWQSGATQTIRVPIALTSQIFDYARKLDQGEEIQPDFDNQALLQVIDKLEAVLQTPRNNFSKERKALLKSAIDELKSLVTRDIV
jgi:hypothetical protein